MNESYWKSSVIFHLVERVQTDDNCIIVFCITFDFVHIMQKPTNFLFAMAGQSDISVIRSTCLLFIDH